jgi:hypothetical protein
MVWLFALTAIMILFMVFSQGLLRYHLNQALKGDKKNCCKLLNRTTIRVHNVSNCFAASATCDIKNIHTYSKKVLQTPDKIERWRLSNKKN